MNREERRNYMDNIQESTNMIAETEAGSSAVSFLLERYGVSDPGELCDSDLSEFYSELYALEADMRD